MRRTFKVYKAFCSSSSSILSPSPDCKFNSPSMAGEEGGGDDNSVPGWLRSLLEERFFELCDRHESAAKKNEKNVFCLDCGHGLCPHCLPRHPKSSHRLLQIRRYVYNDVIRLSDAQKLLDCSLVQPYTTNSAKVVFLNQRPMSRPFRCSGSSCSTCDRSLQDSFTFCSLFCKVQNLIYTSSKKPKPKNKPLDYANPELGTTLLPQFTYGYNNGAPPSPPSPSSIELVFSVSANYLDRASTSAPTSNKSRYIPPPDLVAVARRKKGVPQRSPLY
ncbi:hypothetical protein MLD38_036539 [Melastoma candidum]|uniref:Uncharacterized protein n=1 Tax=Melastoma candidum TaxID=119954 RepID=A0ACB9LLW4_9MYRT|nr:hypothetical protein MLD38_036539 [Melastoma candidum]